MTFWAVGAAAAGVVGGALISGSASRSAADTQAQSTRDATAAQREALDKQIALQEPWRLSGMAGLGKLNSLLGLTPPPSGTTALTMPGAPPAPAPAQQRTGGATIPENQFNAQAYLDANPDVAAVVAQGLATPYGHYLRFGQHEQRPLGPAPASSPTQMLTPGADGVFAPASGINEQAYLAANPDVAQYIAEHPAGSVGATTASEHYRLFGEREGRPTGGPGFTSQPGSLLTNPGAGMHAFTAADFVKDPGYDFRQTQGERGLTRAAAAQGGFGSGKYLKDAMTFNQGLASQEYGNAYSRFNTDQTNQYNRAVTDQTNTFNRLAAVSGIGQTAANTLTAATGNFGQQAGGNIIGAGNAQAAGQIGTANALNGAIGQGISMYQTNQLLNRFPAYSGGYPGGAYNPGAGTVGDFPISYYG